MGFFIFAIILWVAMLACAGLAALIGGTEKTTEYGRKTGEVHSRAPFITGAVALALLGFGCFVLGGLKSVPVKNIGVPSSFGSVGANVFGPGTHQTWTPWLHLTDVDETVQTTTFEGQDCLKVRIGGQQQACADTTIQWQILPSAAPQLFSDYANHGDLMQTIENAVVVREFKQVVNQVVGDYNPITDVQTVTSTNSSTSQFSGFGPQILNQMRADIGSRIDVLSVQLPFMNYTSQVESKLQAIQQAYANYAIATENVKVNQENALAFAKLGAPSLNQLVAQCLTDVKENQNLPVGFQCFPGSGSSLALQK